ncbi:MAG: site-specific integrase [Oxalobacter sp.]|nr:site-specific integrase [Oxalobacter sp.]
MVRIAFYSGMRLGEILSLGNTSKILDDGFLLMDTKNGEDRFVPMHPNLKATLKYLPIPWSEKWMQQCVRKAMDEVGLQNIRFHDLRHSTASNLINAGADLYTVGVVLGHKDMRSTARYSHLAKKTLNDVIRKIR